MYFQSNVGASVGLGAAACRFPEFARLSAMPRTARTRSGSLTRACRNFMLSWRNSRRMPTRTKAPSCSAMYRLNQRFSGVGRKRRLTQNSRASQKQAGQPEGFHAPHIPIARRLRSIPAARNRHLYPTEQPDDGLGDGRRIPAWRRSSVAELATGSAHFN